MPAKAKALNEPPETGHHDHGACVHDALHRAERAFEVTA